MRSGRAACCFIARTAAEPPVDLRTPDLVGRLRAQYPGLLGELERRAGTQ